MKCKNKTKMGIKKKLKIKCNKKNNMGINNKTKILKLNAKNENRNPEKQTT